MILSYNWLSKLIMNMESSRGNVGNLSTNYDRQQGNIKLLFIDCYKRLLSFIAKSPNDCFFIKFSSAKRRRLRRDQQRDVESLVAEENRKFRGLQTGRTDFRELRSKRIRASERDRDGDGFEVAPVRRKLPDPASRPDHQRNGRTTRD